MRRILHSFNNSTISISSLSFSRRVNYSSLGSLGIHSSKVIKVNMVLSRSIRTFRWDRDAISKCDNGIRNFNEIRKELSDVRNSNLKFKYLNSNHPKYNGETFRKFDRLDTPTKNEILRLLEEKKGILQRADQDCIDRVNTNLSDNNNNENIHEMFKAVLDRDCFKEEVKQTYSESTNLLANKDNLAYKVEHSEYCKYNISTLRQLQENTEIIKQYGDNTVMLDRTTSIVEDAIKATNVDSAVDIVQRIAEIVSTFV